MMSINHIIRNIQEFLAGKSWFTIPAESQYKYIQKLGEADNDIDRSYKQYLCQRYSMPFHIRILNDLLTGVSFPFMLVYLFINGFAVRRYKRDHIDCIGKFSGMEEIIPDELKQCIHIDVDHWAKNRCLYFRDLLEVFKLVCHHPLSPLFCFKNMVNMSSYSFMIHHHTPQLLVVHDEFSFTSSFLTYYCHLYGVKHYDVMHGEKLFFIRDAYFHYDKCFVWSSYYVSLFRELKAEGNQFVISVPQSMKIDRDKYYNKEYYADYKYYLASTSKEQLMAIVEAMKVLSNSGKSIKYRLHPRYSDKQLVESLVGRENVEYPQDVDIIYSIANCGCVIGCYSTVLNQAMCSGIPVMIDDVSDKELFKKLKSFKYVLIEKEAPLLSQLN